MVAVSALRRDMLAAARERGHARPETLTDHELSWWLYDHPARAEEQSISLEELSETPKKARRR